MYSKNMLMLMTMMSILFGVVVIIVANHEDLNIYNKEIEEQQYQNIKRKDNHNNNHNQDDINNNDDDNNDSTDGASNSATNAKKYKFKSLVLEGGGTKAISYIGALLAFKELGYYRDGHYKFETIGGTSAGCLMGLMISLDIKPSKLEELVYKIDLFQNIVNFDTSLLETMTTSTINTNNNNGGVGDSIKTKLSKFDKQTSSETTFGFRSPFSWFRAFTKTFDLISWARDIIDLWLKKDSPGLSDEEMFVAFMNNIILPLSPHKMHIQNITTLRFNDLMDITGHDLRCFATQINDHIVYEFSTKRTPNDKVLNAVYASMSLPGVFKPLMDDYDKTLVDGALLYNFPITMNDYDTTIDHETLGLSLNRKVEINQSLARKNRKNDIEAQYTFKFSDISTLDYIEGIYSALINRETYQYSTDSRNDKRIIYLDSPIKTVDLNIDNAVKSLAISKAYLSTLSFMSKNK